VLGPVDELTAVLDALGLAVGLDRAGRCGEAAGLLPREREAGGRLLQLLGTPGQRAAGLCGGAPAGRGVGGIG
jgi:hypothetical protein